MNKQKAYEKLVEITRNNDYTTGNFLYYLDHQNCYKLIDIDLSRQTNVTIPNQTNFTGKLEEENGATCFSLLKSSKKLF